MLIFDEVMTSRLHPGGLSAKLGIEPDLKTLGKYIGGGMSFGAFGGKREIMELFDPAKPNALPHAGTFNNNTLTMTVGHAAMTEIFTPEACADLNARGDTLRDGAQRSVHALPGAHEGQGQGSMITMHPAGGAVFNAGADARMPTSGLRQLLFLDLLDQGIYIAERGFMALSLMVTDEDCRRVVAAVESHIVDSAGSCWSKLLSTAGRTMRLISLTGIFHWSAVL